MPASGPVSGGTRPVTVLSSDGVRLAGIAVPAATPRPPGRPITFVVAHGFTNSVSRPSFLRLAGWLSRFGDVRAVDFRGHGASGGGSTAGGDPEMRDLDAAVGAARADAADGARTRRS